MLLRRVQKLTLHEMQRRQYRTATKSGYSRLSKWIKIIKGMLKFLPLQCDIGRWPELPGLALFQLQVCETEPWQADRLRNRVVFTCFLVLYYTDYTAFTWFYDVAKWVKVLVQTDVNSWQNRLPRCASMNRCSNRVPPGCVDPMAWTRRLRLFQKTEICDGKLLNLLNVHDKFMTENTSCWMLLAFPLCFSGSPEHLG